MITRRTLIGAGLAGPLLLPSAATASWTPTGRNVTLVVPFAPGGGADVAMRHIRDYAARSGITVVADYKGGAEGLIAMRHAASLPADGHNLTLATIGTLSHNRDGFDALESLDLITGIRYHVFFVFVNARLGINSLGQLIDRLRDPAGGLTGGAGAPGQRMAMEDLLRAAGVQNAVIANYRGSSGVVQDVSGGHIAWGMVPGNVVAPLMNGGQIRVIATERRPGQVDTAPGIPSIFDTLPLFDKLDFTLVAMPRGASREVREFWSDWFRRYNSDPNVLADLTRDHSTMVPFGPDHIRSSVIAWRERFPQGRE